MYIHPFVLGIAFTILVEIGLAIVLTIVLSKKQKKNKENK